MRCIRPDATVHTHAIFLRPRHGVTTTVRRLAHFQTCILWQSALSRCIFLDVHSGHTAKLKILLIRPRNNLIGPTDISPSAHLRSPPCPRPFDFGPPFRSSWTTGYPLDHRLCPYLWQPSHSAASLRYVPCYLLYRLYIFASRSSFSMFLSGPISVAKSILGVPAFRLLVMWGIPPHVGKALL